MSVRTGKAAMDWARSQTRKVPSGMCQQFTRMAFNVGSGYPSAAAAWRGAKKKHPTSDPMRVPPAVPVYFLGGSKGYGHAAVSLGNGLVRSTDWPSRYNIGTARISDIERVWGQQFVGWSEDINGVTVYQKDQPKTPNITTALRTRDPQKRRSALRAVVKTGKGAAVKKAAEKWLNALNSRDEADQQIKRLREQRDKARGRIKEARSVLSKHEVR